MNVLIVDDNPDHRELLRRKLQKEFPGVHTTDITRQADLDAALQRADFDFVLTDYRLNWTDGLTILKMMRERMPEVPVVMVTDTGTEEIAAEGMKSGLSDYVLKGHLHRIPLVIRESLEKARLRKEREDALRRLKISEERYRAVSELCSDYAYSYQVSGERRFQREWTTQAFSRITGYDIDVLDKPEGWMAFVHPEDRHIFEKRDERLLAGYPHVCEFRIFSKDGTVHWIRDYIRPVWDEKENRVVRVFGASQDITERQQAREERDRLIREQAERKEAEASERRYRSLAEAIPQMVWSAGADGSIDYFNRRWYDYTGKTFEETQGWSWVSVLHPDDEKACLRTWREAVRTGQRYEIEYRLRRFDGVYRWHLGRAVPARDADESIVKWFGTCTDVDDQKRSEEALRQSAKLESIGLLAGGVAHDFNNLLTGIMGNASLAIDLLSEPDPARPLIQDVLQASERAADLTRQLLAYSGKGRFVVKAVSVSRVTQEIAHLIQASIPKKVDLQMRLEPDLPLVHADPGQIQQLIMNLVINGAEAIGEQNAGTVEVSTRLQTLNADDLQNYHGFEITPGLYVCLEVRDTGCGMDEKVKSQIFDPFFTTKFMGRGLGLAAAQGIVRSHKGAIRVASAPGAGSCFDILLPAAEAAPAKPKRPAAAAGTLKGSATILVVDDEEVVRKAAKAALERFGYKVMLAENGLRAVEMFEKAPDQIEVVIIDMTMPMMGGEEALRRLRLLRPNLRAIASSGYSQVVAMQRFGSQKLSEFVQKPYTAEQLGEKVKAALSNPSEP